MVPEDQTNLIMRVDTYYTEDTNIECALNVKISPQLYNNFRKILKDAQNISMRMFMNNPKLGGMKKTRLSMHSNEPVSEINKFGYNPTLERRLSYKVI